MGSGRLLDHRVLLGIPVPSSRQRGLSDGSAKLIAANKDEYFWNVLSKTSAKITSKFYLYGMA